jgi:glycosyltransferase involved in cell wall biosynthesis
LQYLECLLDQFQPDVVFIWGMWNLPRTLPALAEARCPRRIVYRFAEYWPTLPSQHEFYWRAPGRTFYGRLLKGILGRLALTILAREKQPPPLKFEHAICVSAATRDLLVEEGIPVAHARIIHTGLEVTRYLNGDRPYSQNKRLTMELLYAGRLAADKGVETAIEAIQFLVHDQGIKHARLSLAGSGSADYTHHLHHLVARAGLESYVKFLGWIPYEEMPSLMRQFDALLVPSKWPEPFARVVLEGMILGLAVVASTSGGTGEIIVDGENGLLFAPDDSQGLTQKLANLAADEGLLQKLQENGRKTVVEDFTLSKMMDAYEYYLQKVADKHVSGEILQG